MKILFVPGFNPILVRLQQQAARRRRARSVAFQSHLGSITTIRGALPALPGAHQFQSHLGSITTLGVRALGLVPQRGFNPILVRLQRD